MSVPRRRDSDLGRRQVRSRNGRTRDEHHERFQECRLVVIHASVKIFWEKHRERRGGGKRRRRRSRQRKLTIWALPDAYDLRNVSLHSDTLAKSSGKDTFEVMSNSLVAHGSGLVYLTTIEEAVRSAWSPSVGSGASCIGRRATRSRARQSQTIRNQISSRKERATSVP